MAPAIFRARACPAESHIPTEDADAWTWYPRQRWVYDKLAIALQPGPRCRAARHDAAAFSGLLQADHQSERHGRRQPRHRSRRRLRAANAPGHIWMTLLEGRHVSSDVAVVDGEPRWWRHVTGKPGGEGTFDFWTVHAAPHPDSSSAAAPGSRRHLAGYTGMLNLETIGGAIIEVHLRFSDQWPDLYGAGWVEALIRLYQAPAPGASPTATGATATASCCSDRTGRATAIRRARWSTRCCGMPGVSSVQITFHEDRAARTSTPCRPAAFGSRSSMPRSRPGLAARGASRILHRIVSGQRWAARLRHARACPGHPRLITRRARRGWPGRARP